MTAAHELESVRSWDFHGRMDYDTYLDWLLMPHDFFSNVLLIEMGFWA